LINHFTAYPNPTTEFVEITIPNINLEKVSATLYNILHQKVSEKTYQLNGNKIRVSLNSVPSGMYYIRLNLDTPINFKIIKQ
jgi:hypothetical protein